jgi:putative PEP-CTERM system TPR-repeat lipoprotein
MTKNPIALAIALAFVSAAGFSGCDRTANLTEQEHIQRAKDFEAKGDLKTSVIELKNAVQNNPNSAQARLLLGQVYLKTGQGAEAEKELLRAKSLGVGEDSIKPYLAKSLLLQGEFQRLLDEITLTGRESAANKSRILSLFGDAKTALRQLDEACSLYQESLNVDASNVPAHWGLASCAYARGKVAEAYSRLQTALKIDPRNSVSWVLLGDLERAEKKPDAAEAAYSSALKQDPENVDGLFKHASLMMSQGKANVAQQDLDKIRKAAPGHYLGDFLQALLYFAADKTDPALDATLKSLKARPDNIPAYLLLGSLQYNKKSYGQAAKTLSQYLQLVPGSVDARKILAATYLKTGEPEQTLVLLKPLLAAKIDDPQLFALAAEAYMLLKEPDTASSLFEKASDLVPADAAMQTQLALSRMASGDTAKAITDLERVSRGDSGESQSAFVLALHYLRNKQPDKALEALAQLEKTSPNDPSLHNMKGAAYGSKNDFANARKSFEKALALAPDYFSAARNLAQLDLAQNKPADARRRYETILTKDNKSVRAMVALAQLASLEGKSADYLSWLNKAVKADPKAIQPRVLLARHYIEQKQGEKALALAREAVDANPDSPAALSLLGKTQLSVGQKENALSSFTRLVQDNPASADAHYHLGLAQRALDRTDMARASLKQALEKQPDYLPAQEALIELESQSGHTDEALRLASALQAQQPKSPVGPSLEGDIYLTAGNYAKAARAFQRASALRPSSMLAVKRHQALALSGADKEADAVVKQWLSNHPDDLFVHTYLARHYLLAGRDREAIATHEWLLKKAPRDIGLLNNLAWLYQKTGDARAMRTAEEAYRLAPENPAIQDTLGWLLVQRGDAARGRDLLAKAMAKSGSLSVRYHYAAALAQTGDKTKAQQELERILKSARPFSERAQAEALLKSL